MNIQLNSIWKEIDEDDPQTYRVIKQLNEFTWVIQHLQDGVTCRVGPTFFQYAKEQK
jgi:hypothetical protein